MAISRADGGRRQAPVAPGEVLRERFMAPLGLSARALAGDVGVPTIWVIRLLRGGRPVTAPMAILLARRFETSPSSWMELQVAHDLALAREAMAEA